MERRARLEMRSHPMGLPDIPIQNGGAGSLFGLYAVAVRFLLRLSLGSSLIPETVQIGAADMTARHPAERPPQSSRSSRQQRRQKEHSLDALLEPHSRYQCTPKAASPQLIRSNKVIFLIYSVRNMETHAKSPWIFAAVSRKQKKSGGEATTRTETRL
jgi:hypothetical protein